MASPNTLQPVQPGTNPARRQQDAAHVLSRVFGEEVLAALYEGFLQGDLTGVVPLLTATTAKPHLRQAAQDVFLAACLENEAGAAALLLEGDGVDGNAVVDPSYVRNDEDWLDSSENEAGDTVLTRAAREGRSGMVRALVESGKADVNHAAPNGELPLVLAIYTGEGDCVEALLAADGIDTTIASSSFCDRTPLTAAAMMSETDLVRRFLAVDGVAVNWAESGSGYTALMYAAQDGHAGCVRALLRAAGIDANFTNVDGETALSLAACYGHRDCVHLLLAVGGIDVNQASGGDSALLDAVTHRHGDWEGCARALASAKGIDLNQPREYTRQTALHMVCSHKHAALAAHLLTAGGCRFARDNASGTALALAAGDKAVTKVFASGVDYWQRRLHGGHAWAMKEAVQTLLLVRQRLDARALLDPAPAAAGSLPHLPEEIWLAALAFLRSADFMP